MSNRQSLVVFAVLMLLVLRWLASGKLGRVWAALTTGRTGGSGPATPAAPSSSSSGGSGLGAAIGKAGDFGLTNVTQTLDATAFGEAAGDRNLLSDMTGEVNYLLPAGSQEPFDLPQSPGRNQWSLVKVIDPSASGGVGGIEEWQDATGAPLVFLHLSQVLPEGTQEPGGNSIAAGVTGWPLSPLYGIGGVYGPQNAHLAVIYDARSAHYIGGKA